MQNGYWTRVLKFYTSTKKILYPPPKKKQISGYAPAKQKEMQNNAATLATNWV